MWVMFQYLEVTPAFIMQKKTAYIEIITTMSDLRNWK